MCEAAAHGVWRYQVQREPSDGSYSASLLLKLLFCASCSPVPSMALNHGADSHIPVGSAGFAALGVGTQLSGDVVWPWLAPLVGPCLC